MPKKTLSVDAIAKLGLPHVIQPLTLRDMILYALGPGFGDDPLNEGFWYRWCIKCR